MKVLRICLAFLLLCSFSDNLKSQESESVFDELIAKVENDYNSLIDRIDKMSISNLSPNRKFKIEVVNKASGIMVKTKIKYYRNGFKKEKISIYKRSGAGNFVFICRAIKLNNSFFNIRYNNCKLNDEGLLIIQSQELLYDSRFYRKKSYDEDGKLIKTDNVMLKL